MIRSLSPLGTHWQASLDFRLKPGAAALDSGKPVTGITDGFLGKAPELGAYEAGGPRWVPGRNGQAAEPPLSPTVDNTKAPL